jgi:hypothetical protein
MFKKTTLGLSALTLYSVGAISLESTKHHKHHRHNHSLAGLNAESVPNCTSYECRNNQVTIGYAGPQPAASLAQQIPTNFNAQGSDPSWNSDKGYNYNTAAYPFHLEPKENLAQSIPACNSYQHSKKECEKETAAAPLM